MNCVKCGRELSRDDMGLYKKLVSPKAESFWCIHCIGEHFNVSVDLLQEKIAQYKEMNCSCFE